MKLTAFQSDKGDCLLLESANGSNRMLIDGGMKAAYTTHVAPAMGALRKAKKKIDVVYVSHIDQDHISGVLQLLDDEAARRVHLHQKQSGNPSHPEPESPRPPEIGKIYHNSFHDQVGKNSGKIEDMLAATAEILAPSDNSWLQDVAERRQDIASSIPEALRVSRRIKPGQLNIPLNPEFGGKLMMIGGAEPDLRVGTIRLKMIGPFAEDLRKLRSDWNDWLGEHQKEVKKIREQAEQDEENIGASSLDRTLGPMFRSAQRLGSAEIELAKELGDRDEVTAPNLASLMFFAREGEQTMLLTGDGHCADVLKGLDHHQLLVNGSIHVDLLKVQHHGSENNIDKNFCDHVTADNYVLCGNGQHENPDLDVLELIFDQRMANDQKRFKFWFNSSSKVAKPAGSSHMKAIEKLMSKLNAKSHNRLRTEFTKGSSLRVL